MKTFKYVPNLGEYKLQDLYYYKKNGYQLALKLADSDTFLMYKLRPNSHLVCQVIDLPPKRFHKFSKFANLKRAKSELNTLVKSKNL
jgi:hypothetical protein